MGNPVNACMGLFVLWWGWLAFNSGSTYGLGGAKWQYAARAAVITMQGSFGGGIFGLLFSMYKNRGRVDVPDIINSILGALVSITAGCFLYRAWEALIIGIIGAALAVLTMPVFDRFKIDDPVGATSVHGVAGIWGVLAVGLFADNPIPLTTTGGRSGLFKGGGWDLFGVQCLAALSLTVWGIVSTSIILWLISKIVPLRMNPTDELLGTDLVEHNIRHSHFGMSRAISTILPHRPDLKYVTKIDKTGFNPAHDRVIADLRFARTKLHQWNTQAGVAPAVIKRPTRNIFPRFSGKIALGVNIFRRKQSAFSRRLKQNIDKPLFRKDSQAVNKLQRPHDIPINTYRSRAWID